MPTTHVTKEAVTLDGYQYIGKPGKFGFCLETLLPDSIVSELEEERTEALEWALGKTSNPKRAVAKPTPWEETSAGEYKVKFTWKEDKDLPVVVDSEGTPIPMGKIPDVRSGSKVKLAFKQTPYVLPDQLTYGTRLKLSAIQLVKITTGAGVINDMDADEAVALFGKAEGGFTFDSKAPADDEDVEF